LFVLIDSNIKPPLFVNVPRLFILIDSNIKPPLFVNARQYTTEILRAGYSELRAQSQLVQRVSSMTRRSSINHNVGARLRSYLQMRSLQRAQ